MQSVLLLTVHLALSSFLSSKEVSLPVDGDKLVGTRTPSEKITPQVVFILSGSGPTDRDGHTVGAPGKNNSLKYLVVLKSRKPPRSHRFRQDNLLNLLALLH